MSPDELHVVYTVCEGLQIPGCQEVQRTQGKKKKNRSVNDVQQLESRSSGVLCMYVTTATDAEDYSILAEGALRTVMNVKRCPS